MHWCVGAGGYTSAESESEYIPDNRPMSAPLLDHPSYSLPPQPAYSPVKVEVITPIRSKQSVRVVDYYCVSA